MIIKIPKFAKFLISIILINLVIYSIYRYIFYISFLPIDLEFDTIKAFVLGMRFDLQFLIISFLPILFFARVKYIDIFDSSFGKKIWVGYLSLHIVFSTLFYIGDYYYYEHFGKRVDATVISFFYDFKDAFTMFSEGYPIWKITIFITLLLVFSIKFYLFLINYFSKCEDYKYNKKIKKIGLWVVFVFLFILAGYGRIAMFPLRWSDAFYKTESFISALASSPLVYFANTMKNKQIKYNKEKVKYYYDTVANYLQIDEKYKDPNKLHFIREVTPSKSILLQKTKPNIVFVLIESFAYFRIAKSNNPLNATPYFDKIAKEGMLYTKFYVPTGRTARSVFASLTGMPDIERNKTTTRNPLCVKQNIIVNFLEDYAKYYIIGGSTSWGNIRGLLSNIKGLKIFEEDMYSHPRNDVWGISDADLMLEANEIFKKSKKPFYAYIQTAGNHSPFTIPDNRYDFKEITNIKQSKLKKYGFNDITICSSSRLYNELALSLAISSTKVVFATKYVIDNIKTKRTCLINFILIPCFYFLYCSIFF
jgi:phosphoglycerol transferase MdoB-like AlkP superfamily enzyme